MSKIAPEKRPPEAPPVSPHLVVDNAPAALDFYARAFGAEVLFRNDTPDGKKVLHASLRINGGLVMLHDDFPEMMKGKSSTPKALGGTAVTIHLNLPDVDAAWERAVAAGAEVVFPLADQFWGDRYGVVRDPFGHRWSLGTPKRQPTEDEIKEGTAKHFPSS